LFGANRFEIELSDSGIPTTLGFGVDSGVAATVTAANSVVTTAQGQSIAEQAAETKAEADLIAQQQRLIRCQANRETCE
ncbi:MAG: hypothetical protein VXW22_03640, partial [Pseudomonadota bacterium]|nr:hypothetical protein [Pseudomonadota bacterium]